MNIAAPLSWLELHRNSSLSEARLRRLQDRRFQQTVHHAFQWVPFYREAFEKQGLHPQDLRTVRDIGKLPIMSRESLQDVDPASRLDHRLQATDCIERSTGGSTGRPLLSYTGSSELTYETLGWVRTWKRLGLRVGDHQVTIKHPEDIAKARSGKWYQHLGLLRLSYLDLRDPAPKLIDRLCELQPDVLRAQPSVLLSLARELRNRPRNQSIHPRLIFCAGEHLSRNTANFLKETFRAEVHNLYGATEAGCIGWWCPPCERFHINSDYLLVEVLKDGRQARPGEVGEIVITSLYRRSMPVIRMSLGDLAEAASPKSCRHTRETLCLARIVGRTLDSFQLADGSEVSPYNFMPDEMKGVLNYQIVQERPGVIRIRLVTGPGFDVEALGAARVEYEAYLDGKVSITFEVVDQLPVGPGGRFKPAVVTKTGQPPQSR